MPPVPLVGRMGHREGKAVHGIMLRLARWVAIFGGIVLFAIIAVTTVSVAGRLLNTIGHSHLLASSMPSLATFLQGFGSLLGDFELVEVGSAMAITAFLPWCSMKRGHATVDIFTATLHRRANGLIDLLWELVFLVVLTVLAWRLFAGMSDKMRYGETSFLLQFPVWWGYAACAVLMAFAALVSAYMVFERALALGGADGPALEGAAGNGTREESRGGGR